MRLRELKTILLCLIPVVGFGQVQVTTYHNDNARTGQNRNEYLLTPENVAAGSFGKRFTYQVDGQVLGQPLYLPSVKIEGKGTHNVVIAATAHDSVYAFDADSNEGANAEALWHVSFLSSDPKVTSVPTSDVSCLVIAPELGIVGTPVIDPASGILYLVAETKEGDSNYVFRLHALDISTGAEHRGSPVEIASPGFSAFEHKQRAALLLANGMVYVPFGSNCDQGDYHGWIFAYDSATLAAKAVFNASPQDGGSAFWNAGAGPAADELGNIYAVSANGIADLSNGRHEYGDSVIRLNPNLTVADYFTPFNQADLNLYDVDLGSSTAILLPASAGGVEHPYLLATAGKEGRLYLLDRNHLGGAQSESDSGALASLPILGHSLFGAAAYFNGSLFVAPEFAMMRAYKISNGELGSVPDSTASFAAGALGATPSISANGAENGVVWIVTANSNGALEAYRADGLGQPLYSSLDNPADSLDGLVEFSVPTIADGKVYVGTQSALEVYGLISAPTPNVLAATNAASYDPRAIAPGSLISLFGTDLSLITASAGSIPLPVSLADVSVSINGIPAPLLYLSPRQLNVQVPVEVAPGPAQLTVRVAGRLSATASLVIGQSGPGIFAVLGGSAGFAAGSDASVYLTGLGKTDSDIASGDAAREGEVINATLDVTATVGGVNAPVQFAGLAPGFVGVNQVNLQVPQLSPGIYPVVITVDGVSSNAAPLKVAAGN
ncbi:MAG TPA: hypothetical protein VHD76_19405 [Bryobacteraceae bacterium]|nr:hypothetical protein [Bryobacteraceae bacterium]